MEQYRVENIEDLKRIGHERAIQDPTERARVIVEGDIKGSLYNFMYSNVEFIGNGSLPTISHVEFEGSNIEFSKINLSVDIKHCQKIDIRKCFFNNLELEEVSLATITKSTGKNIKLHNSNSVRLYDVDLDGTYGSAINIVDCRDILVLDYEIGYEKEGYKGYDTGINVIKSNNISIFDGKISHGKEGVTSINSSTHVGDTELYKCELGINPKGTYMELNNVHFNDNETSVEDGKLEENDIELFNCPSLVLAKL